MMGGKAFASGPRALYTPRMIPQIYFKAKEDCFAALRPLFPLAQCLIEAPGKTTHGDIDILVCLQDSFFTHEQIQSRTKSAVWSKIEEALNAVRTNSEGNHCLSKNIAVPWPKGLSSALMAQQLLVEERQRRKPAADHTKAEETGKVLNGLAKIKKDDRDCPSATDELVEDDSPETKTRHVQVDVRLCLAREELDWRCFKQNHGDLWHILGTIIDPLGLTANDEALYIRISEFEERNRKASRVYLTSSPSEALELLGLSNENGEMEKPFPSVEAMFRYAASSRWFYPQPSSACDGDDQDTSIGPKSRPRYHKIVKTRTNMDRWVNEFVPNYLETKRCLPDDTEPLDLAQMRTEMRNASFTMFPEAKARYAAQLTIWNREATRIFVKNKLIKGDMAIPKDIGHVLPGDEQSPSGQWRAVLRSALVKIIVDDDRSFAVEGIIPPELRDERGVLLVHEISEWIAENWERVGHAAWREQRARFAESTRLKEERRRGALEAGGSPVAGGENKQGADDAPLA